MPQEKRTRKKKKKRKVVDRLGQAKKVIDKVNPFKKAKDAVDVMRMRHMATIAAAFCHKHSEYLIFIADPKTDVFFMSNDKVHVANRILDEDGRKMKIIRKAIDFNREKMRNAAEVERLLSVISGGLNSMRKTRVEHRSKKYKRIIKQRPKEMTKFKNYDQLKKHHEMEKMKKKEERMKKIGEDEGTRGEQQKLDRTKVEDIKKTNNK